MKIVEKKPYREQYPKKKTKKGRPFSYTAVLAILDDRSLYTGGMIVREAVAAGLVGKDDTGAQVAMRQAFNKLRLSRRFPVKGDGMVKLPGQRSAVAFYGARWKAAI